MCALRNIESAILMSSSEDYGISYASLSTYARLQVYLFNNLHFFCVNFQTNKRTRTQLARQHWLSEQASFLLVHLIISVQRNITIKEWAMSNVYSVNKKIKDNFMIHSSPYTMQLFWYVYQLMGELCSRLRLGSTAALDCLTWLNHWQILQIELSSGPHERKDQQEPSCWLDFAE